SPWASYRESGRVAAANGLFMPVSVRRKSASRSQGGRIPLNIVETLPSIAFKSKPGDRREDGMRNMTSLRTKATVVLVMVAALLLGALSAAAQQTPVRVGGLFPMTGDLSAFGEPFYNSALLAVMQINEQGGILGGRTFELVLA